MDVDSMKALIRDLPDHPAPGVTFRDVTPLLGSPAGFSAVVDAIAAPFAGRRIDKVVGIEARGFLFGAPVAYRHGSGLVPVRKPGKLPWEIEREHYTLEYGTDALEIHRDAIHPGEQVLVIDDVLATGGTASAVVRLVERLGGEVVGLSFVLELTFLAGRAQLPGREIHAVIEY